MFGNDSGPRRRSSLGRAVSGLRASTAVAALAWAAVAWAALALGLGDARAETISGALVKAYLNNPQINTQRAAVRAADENIPRARAGLMPQVNAVASDGVSAMQTVYSSKYQNWLGQNPRGYGVTVGQTLWDGRKTENSMSQAESNVLGQREVLRNIEQNILLQALTAYMDVLKNAAILDLNKSNVQVLTEQLRQTRDRFNVGELTRTDVAQAESSLAGAQAQVLVAESTLSASLATYREVIGDDPKSLAPVAPLTRQLPKNVDQAVAVSQLEHPAIVAALHGVDAALLAIKISEAALLPTLALQGSVSNQWDSQTAPRAKVFNAMVNGQINIPLYDGGATYAGIRQAKEQLGQQELTADQQRDLVRAGVVAAWGANANSAGVIRAAKAQVDSAEVALEGVREQAKVGQRTTLDVLNAQLAVLNARVQLVTAQHDQVVSSYTLLSAIGRLSTGNLGLSVVEYDPRTHFDQVKNKYFGTRTPDGR